ncbi:MAG: LacI family DNA-binding transcriptional regulator [Victivallaceae bacterium]|jgi:DNA-binding LacI/PurR family transcriptional regulator|nr:LacI family DNA-binding transcriptional regulator [Victivallaceae bacterium]
MSKYKDLYEWLKRKILAGDFPEGGRLPTCRDLAKVKGVSYVTASKAIKELANHGLVISRQGHGIFAASADRRKPDYTSRSAQVGFIMQTSGDLFGSFFTPLLEELSNDQLMAVPLANDSILRNLSHAERIERLHSYAAVGFEALVVDGDRCFPFSALESSASDFKQLIFVLRYDTEINFPNANILTADFRQAGYDAAVHLLEQGVKRIAMLTFEELDEVERRISGSSFHTHDQLVLDGIEAAFTEFCVDFKHGCVMLRESEKSVIESQCEKELGNFMAEGTPCGVICVGDFRARHVYHAAHRKNLKIGRDVLVVGMFNTSWSEAFMPGLTTISIEEKDISFLTAQAIREKWQGRKVSIAPRLIIKKSSIKE